MTLSIKDLLSKIVNTPMVIEQGTSGNWTYRQWSDGTAECWGTLSWTITSWSGWGGTYYSNYASATAYPSNLFVSKPTVVANGSASAGDCWLASRGGSTGGTKDETPVFFLMRASSGNSNIQGYANIHAIGRWK